MSGGAFSHQYNRQMKLGIMQPYFFPYIGYFQLANAVDEFVVYDRIEYTKKGWINRNRILVDGRDMYLTLPLRKDSDHLDIDQRSLADTWTSDRIKSLNRIRSAYRKAPYFDDTYSLIEECFLFENTNLYEFITNSLTKLFLKLEIKSRLRRSSEIEDLVTEKGEQRVIGICRSVGATNYINPVGGVEMYSRERFKDSGIELFFLKTNNIEYRQFDNDFVPNLSIIDVLMFNSPERVRELLDNEFTLI